MTSMTPGPERGVKIPHLVLALLFLGSVVAWLLAATGRLDGPDLAYLAPGVLVVAGSFGLLAMALEARPRDRGRGRVSDPEQITEPYDGSDDEPEHTTPLSLDKENR